jgi:hypothetical protein
VYFQSVREASENWNETIDLCAKEVCGALFGGSGNADISGVGVSAKTIRIRPGLGELTDLRC